MTHTVRIKADHKGYTTPRVSGDEYFVDASVLVTAATAGGEEIKASSLGLSSISCVIVTGNSPQALRADAEVVITDSVLNGDYESSSSFALVFIDPDGTVTSGDITDTTVRVRVYGNL